MNKSKRPAVKALKPGYLVHNLDTGEALVLKGYGAMRDKVVFRADIDLTAPIAEQVARNPRGRGKRHSKVVPAA